MLISVVNVTSGTIADADIQTVLRAVNRQIAEDFLPYWGFGEKGMTRICNLTGSKAPCPRQIRFVRGFLLPMAGRWGDSERNAGLLSAGLQTCHRPVSNPCKARSDLK